MNNLDELKVKLEKIKLFVAKEKGKEEEIRTSLENIEKQVLEINSDIELLDKVNILFQKTSEFARNQAKTQIEYIVSKCLQYIFNEDIEFKIEITEVRGRANAKFFVITKMGDLDIKAEPENSKGGGVVDIVSLALRIAFLEIHKPKITGPLILDEPGKHVSNEYVLNVAEFLKQNSEMFNRQTIMITHNSFLASIGDSSNKVKLVDGISVVEPNEV